MEWRWRWRWIERLGLEGLCLRSGRWKRCPLLLRRVLLSPAPPVSSLPGASSLSLCLTFFFGLFPIRGVCCKPCTNAKRNLPRKVSACILCAVPSLSSLFLPLGLSSCKVLPHHPFALHLLRICSCISLILGLRIHHCGSRKAEEKRRK
jgi:hypothetical protein